MNEALKWYLAKIGSKGGKRGKGDAKRRDPEHYRRMVQIRNEKRQQGTSTAPSPDKK